MGQFDTSLFSSTGKMNMLTYTTVHRNTQTTTVRQKKKLEEDNRLPGCRGGNRRYFISMICLHTAAGHGWACRKGGRRQTRVEFFSVDWLRRSTFRSKILHPKKSARGSITSDLKKKIGPAEIIIIPPVLLPDFFQ